MNGWKLAASIGENNGNERVASVAVKGSLMGLSIAAGTVDQANDANDDSFMTLGYSVGGVNLGYGNYDSDVDDTTVMSITTDVAGMTNTLWSQSVYVAYSSTLDNGMGLSVGFTLTPSSQSSGFAVDTGMGTLQTGGGYQVNSAADGMDGLPNNANVKFPNAMFTGLGTYNDGDAGTGEGIKYTSPSMNGWTVAASIGENSSNADRVLSYAASGSLAGVSIAAGVVDTGGANDDTFVTLGYSIGGVGLGYGNYDSDVDDQTALSVTTSVAGYSVGFRYDDLDAATDNSMNTYSIGKDMGGLSLTLMYADQDIADNSRWDLVYAMGF
jgi:hypothetical protein